MLIKACLESLTQRNSVLTQVKEIEQTLLISSSKYFPLLLSVTLSSYHEIIDVAKRNCRNCRQIAVIESSVILDNAFVKSLMRSLSIIKVVMVALVYQTYEKKQALFLYRCLRCY